MSVVSKAASAVDEVLDDRSEQDHDRLTCKRLVVVGGGMAAHGLCERLVRFGAIDQFEVTVIGDEPQVAYDRVNLSKLFDGRSRDSLLLAPPSWYDAHGVTWLAGRRIESIDRKVRHVVDDQGHEHAYDELILATGSHAFVPPLPGVNSDGVFVYRTIDDLAAICQHCDEKAAKRGVVVGGGLLGLEAAKVLMDLGIQVDVIEMAPGLMPRQLDAAAAKLLKQQVTSMGVGVHLVRRIQAIEKWSSGLQVKFFNAEDLHCDVLIIAAGVRPNDSLAADAGLEIGPRRGVVVDDQLRTSDPSIYAIGECASFRDHVFGLVAPCYRMADVLAQRLAKQPSRFDGADESAELKLLGVRVATIGRVLDDSPGGVVLTHHCENGYRKIILEKGRIVGASCVGDWDELPQIRQAIHRGTKLRSWHRKRFDQTGSPWVPGGSLPVAQWPGDAIICSCLSVNKSTIARVIGEGATCVQDVATNCGAGTACGSCRALVAELTGGTSESVRTPGADNHVGGSGGHDDCRSTLIDRLSHRIGRQRSIILA